MLRPLIAIAMALAAGPATASRLVSPAAPFLFTPMDERGAAFSPDGKTAVYALRIGEYRQVLVVVERRGKAWGEPEVPSFSGLAYDASPSFSPDGRRLYFASNRAAADGTKGDFDIWMVARTAREWGIPEPVRGGVNSQANETGPALTRSGRLYFASSQSGNGDIYVADPGPKGFGVPRSVGPGVNSDYTEGYPAISPDEKVLVFMSSGRPDALVPPGQPYGRSDLYISRWNKGRWGQAKRLGSKINTRASESSPAFSADGRWFYFMSEHGFATDQKVLLRPETLRRGLASARNGFGNIYVIAASAIEGQR
jgi:Tol biopolymer transport system component